MLRKTNRILTNRFLVAPSSKCSLVIQVQNETKEKDYGAAKKLVSFLIIAPPFGFSFTQCLIIPRKKKEKNQQQIMQILAKFRLIVFGAAYGGSNFVNLSLDIANLIAHTYPHVT